ncbi:MAG TPA: type II toxin-antitoxin system RelE/ParE family toxin [Verrucomicrobiae bacterium]
MDFKVFLSDDALSDLERIVAYITPHNAVAAGRIGNQLLGAALSLRTFPERGRMVPEFRRPELREIIFRSYRIIYRMNDSDQSLEIVRFWHGARGFPHIPGEDQNA